MLKRFLGRFGSWSPANLALLALAVVLFVSAAVRVALAARGPVRFGDPDALEVPGLPSPRDVLPQTAPEAIVRAISTDPFRPDRSAPLLRYQPGSGRGRSAEQGPDRRPRIPDLRLRGTAVYDGGGLAVIEGMPGRRGVRVYGPGDTIGDFRLEVIDGDSVVFVCSDTTFVLKILRPWKPGPR